MESPPSRGRVTGFYFYSVEGAAEHEQNFSARNWFQKNPRLGGGGSVWGTPFGGRNGAEQQHSRSYCGSIWRRAICKLDQKSPPPFGSGQTSSRSSGLTSTWGRGESCQGLVETWRAIALGLPSRKLAAAYQVPLMEQKRPAIPWRRSAGKFKKCAGIIQQRSKRAAAGLVARILVRQAAGFKQCRHALESDWYGPFASYFGIRRAHRYHCVRAMGLY